MHAERSRRRAAVLIQVCVCFTCRFRGSSARVRRSRQEGVSGRRLLHQRLHRDAQLHQALLLQDVVRKTQFVLREQSQRDAEEQMWRQRRDTKDLETKTLQSLAHAGLHTDALRPGDSHSPQSNTACPARPRLLHIHLLDY